MARHNLGAIERSVRLLLGLSVGGWALTQPELGLLEGLALFAASLLILNFLFGRCYLWQLLNINSCGQCKQSRHRRVGA